MSPRLLVAILLLAVVLVLALVISDIPTTEVPVTEKPASVTLWPTLPPLLPLPAPPTTERPTLPRSHTTAPTMRGDGIWDRVAFCESGGRWDDTRGGYFGGLHFMLQTWVAAGGQRFAATANLATREQQIMVAKAWLARTSVRQWPVCGPRSGLTMGDAA